MGVAGIRAEDQELVSGRKNMGETKTAEIMEIKLKDKSD